MEVIETQAAFSNLPKPASKRAKKSTDSRINPLSGFQLRGLINQTKPW
jgi:hypothetical protein